MENQSGVEYDVKGFRIINIDEENSLLIGDFCVGAKNSVERFCCHVLIDTGSSFSMFSPYFRRFSKVKVDKNSEPLLVTGFGGTKPTSMRKLSQVHNSYVGNIRHAQKQLEKVRIRIEGIVGLSMLVHLKKDIIFAELLR